MMSSLGTKGPPATRDQPSARNVDVLPTDKPNKPSGLVACGKICKKNRAARVNDCGQREQHWAVVEREAVAVSAADDPAPKCSNERPQDEHREDAKDDFAEWIYRTMSLECDKSGVNI